MRNSVACGSRPILEKEKEKERRMSPNMTVTTTDSMSRGQARRSKEGRGKLPEDLSLLLDHWEEEPVWAYYMRQSLLCLRSAWTTQDIQTIRDECMSLPEQPYRSTTQTNAQFALMWDLRDWLEQYHPL